jgi:hypothetical protein
MKFFGAVALLVAGTGAWAGDAGRMPQHLVTVCLNLGGNAGTIARGEATATQILKQAGIRLEWRLDENSCTAEGNGLVVSVSYSTPEDRHRGEFAYAMPFERTHIALLYDRVLSCVAAYAVPILLGHVMAHEIVHMLQGVNVHSASGIMKAHWNYHDYVDMQRAQLKFSRDDIDLIDHGLEWRAAMPVLPNGRPQYHDVTSNDDGSRAASANRRAVLPGR